MGYYPFGTITDVTVTMDASGNINNTTEIESIMDKDYMCSRVVGLVGEPFSIETTSDFTEATLTFKVDKTKLGDTEFDNLMFLWYDEENDNFVELETEHDVDASTVSITTTHFSKYCIVDAKTWFENWKMIAEKIESPSPSIATAIIIKCQNRNDPYFDFDEYDENGNVTDTIRANYRSLIVDNLIDTMSDKDMIGFTYYQRSGGMLNGFESDKDEIDSIKENYYYNLSLGGFNQLTNINWGIDSAGSSLIYNAKDSIKRIVMITDSDISYNSIYVNILKSHSISVYFFCIGDFKTTNIQTLADGTGGEVFQIVNSNEPEEVKETICYMEQVEREKASRKPDNTPHYSDEDEFYDEQEIDGLIYNSCGERVYTDFLKGDTDDDGLLDSEEVSVFESFEDVQLENQYYYGRKYFHQMYSDPNNADTDGDGLWDDEDYAPKTPMTDDEKIVYEFFSNAEFFEIDFVLENPWLQELGTLKGIKCVEICRDHAEDRNLDAIKQDMIDADIIANPSEQSTIDKVMNFFVGNMNPAAMLFTEYENYRIGISFADIVTVEWLKWSNAMKMVSQIWVFGVADLLVNNWAKYDYSTDYKLSLSLEQTMNKYSEIINKNKIVNCEAAEDVNKWYKDVKNYSEPPYKIGSHTYTIELTEDTNFVRVYDKNIAYQEGGWCMEYNQIEGLTPAQIKDKFALQYEPKYICDVTVPKGEHIRLGYANPISKWGNGGGIQFDSMGQEIFEFYNERML